MKALEELKQHYTQDLLPELSVLEVERKNVLKKILFVTLIIFPVVIFTVVVLIRISHNLAGFAVFLGVAAWMGFYAFFTKGYVSSFKTGIIKKIVKFIDDKLTYSKFGKINQGLFTASGIFRHRIDHYKGDDHVSGVLGKTKVEFSEIYASYDTTDSRGRKTENIIFKGLFFTADFNKSFNGNTVVLPDTAEKFLGHIGTFFQSMNKTRGELIKLEDPVFEKLFAVYGNDQIEARYLLSTSLMKRIVEFQKKTGKRIYLSFAGSRIFVAIPYAKDLFEPRVFQTVLDFKPVQEYFEDLQLTIGIIDDLNLNTRIWSKQ